jgi:hypothetical protein
MTQTLVHTSLRSRNGVESESLNASRWFPSRSNGHPQSSFPSIRTSLASAPAQRLF